MTTLLSAEEYYARLQGVWDAMKNGTLSSKQWMKEYDHCFEQCAADNNEAVYGGFRLLFKETSKTETDQDTYFAMAESICRIGSYLHRFWIPLRAFNDENYMPLFDLARIEWENAQ